ncbi:MAPEG family protein [Novosphingobium piscinae]|uniref:MAPEG family protein n=1 Tax=Novosphingobium piscinae TaxID=1507448 RepID=A0A7X1FXF7_9SPHN|nr:MAPEG family protein [Novosphingobium piscinae]MBC2668087.1 MAPEG family protein [Novosphingobium piscinae]
MNKALLAPAAVLVAWSLVMMLWMARSRFAAMANSGIDLGKARPGGRGQDLEAVLPPEVMWKSHNYTHLMEQPTLFYAVVVILALAGGTQTDALLAWAYTGLRVVHSVYQATTNRVPVRFAIFFTATLCLMALAVRALLVTL